MSSMLMPTADLREVARGEEGEREEVEEVAAVAVAPNGLLSRLKSSMLRWTLMVSILRSYCRSSFP